MMTLAAPLRGHVRGVIAADLKLDNFGDLVNAQRPGTHGTAIVFDSFGVLLAHPDFGRLVNDVNADPSDSQNCSNRLSPRKRAVSASVSRFAA